VKKSENGNIEDDFARVGDHLKSLISKIKEILLLVKGKSENGNVEKKLPNT